MHEPRRVISFYDPSRDASDRIHNAADNQDVNGNKRNTNEKWAEQSGRVSGGIRDLSICYGNAQLRRPVVINGEPEREPTPDKGEWESEEPQPPSQRSSRN